MTIPGSYRGEGGDAEGIARRAGAGAWMFPRGPTRTTRILFIIKYAISRRPTAF